MILVVGATGTNGREVVSRLAAAGERVRAMVRNPARAEGLRSPHTEIVAGDLDDSAALRSALAGVERAFFLGPVDSRYVDWFRAFLDASRAAALRHVVRFSAMGASLNSASELLRQHGEADQMLVDSGLPYTILQPNSFYQNLLWSVGSIKDQGAFYLPLGDARLSLVDVRDIASVSLHVLTRGGHEGQTYEITGPESLSNHEVAAKLSAAIGRPVQYVSVPAETALDAMLKGGMPEWNARAVCELYAVFTTGQGAHTTDAVERITGQKPISFDQFTRDHAEAFR